MSCMPRWPGELWVYMQSLFLSVLSWWSLFDGYCEKSSAGKNHLTKQGRSSHWAGTKNASTSVSHHLSLPPLYFCRALDCNVTLVSPTENTTSRFAWALWKDISWDGGRKKSCMKHEADMYGNITFKTNVVYLWHKYHTLTYSAFIIVSNLPFFPKVVTYGI